MHLIFQKNSIAPPPKTVALPLLYQTAASRSDLPGGRLSSCALWDFHNLNIPNKNTFPGSTTADSSHSHWKRPIYNTYNQLKPRTEGKASYLILLVEEIAAIIMRSISNFLASLALLLVSKLGNDPATGFTTVSRYNDRAMAPIPTVTSVNSKPHLKSSLPASISPLFHHPRQPNEKYNGISSYDKKLQQQQQRTQRSIASKLLQRIPKPQFDTLAAANLEHALTAGLFGSALQRVKKLHDPKTYLVLGLLSGLKWDWCFKSPYFWFAMGFCIKWYRARYVYKIPVWDRQPNWNNVITSKEQEKDLKAFTCKNCGSTIFIAKTREFFFEGSTG